MKPIVLACSVLIVSSFTGCSNSSNKHFDKSDSIDTVSPLETNVDDGFKGDIESMKDEGLSPFKAVIDTLNSAGDNLVHSEYFLHDITGDGHPELWIVSGTCEADKDLWVYTVTDSSVKKILSDYGGHTEFFLKGNTMGSLTCNTGSGYVSGYTYTNGKILVESIEYDGWHEKDMVKVKSKRDRAIADVWENSDSTINLKPLK